MSTVGLNTNIAALRARRRLDEADSGLQRALTRLSSGMRINQSSDDAAGSAVAMGLESQAKVFSQASRNGSDGISLLSVVDGALSNLSTITQRQMELAQQAANGTLSAAQRRALQQESTSLTKEYNRTLQATDFNKMQLMNYGLSPLTLQLGYGVSGSITFDRNYDLSRVQGTGNFVYNGGTTGTTSSGALIAVDWDGDGFLDLVQSSGDVFHNDGSGGVDDVDTVSGIPIAKADMNGDGKDDLIVRGTGGTIGTYLLGLGGGPQFVTSNVANANFQVGDFNGDGIPDIASWTTGGSATITVAHGSRTGTFTQAYSTKVANPGFGFTVADINGDGLDDFVSTTTSSSITAVLNNGNGTFKTQTTAVAGGYSSLAVVDANNDGARDIITFGGSSYKTWLGGGGGAFTQFASGTFSNAGNFVPAQTIDLNGDGLQDILGFDTSGAISVTNNGDGTFTKNTSATFIYQSSASAIAADLNNDGLIDLATTDNNGSLLAEVGTYLQRSTRTTDAKYFSLSSQSDARNALSLLQSQLDRISSERGKVGSIQSRVSSAVKTVGTASDNLLSARSRIVDADVAAETANLTRYSILRQSAASVLAQANLAPKLALSLLVG